MDPGRPGWRLLALLSAAAVVAATLISMPPRAIKLAPVDGTPEAVRGAVHIHSRRSDGTGTIDEIAAAASRAGLKFVVITDHGDATRQPEPPTYRSGVLCIDAVEITTSGGHLVALGLQDGAPYPLGGDPQDVVDDVARLGGMSLAAHPGSPKASLRWNDWHPPLDGLEWLNADSQWRDEHAGSLVRAIFTYPWRKPETLAALFDRPAEVLRTWDALNSRRRVVAVAAADAHANLGLTNDADGDRSAWHLAIPAYEQLFRTFSVGLPAIRLSGDAVSDAQSVLREIRAGHVYSAIDALASPGRLSFVASSGRHTAMAGDVLALDGPVVIRVHSNAPVTARTVLLSDGREVASVDGPTLQYAAPVRRAAYRVEVRLAGAASGWRVPWLVSNAIYVGGVPGQDRSTPPADTGTALVASLGTNEWSVEKNDASRARVEVVSGRGKREVQLDYALEGAKADSPWIAFNLLPPSELPRFGHLAFSGRSDRPMRLWVQLRTVAPARHLYWRRSIYLDSTERQVVLPFADLRPVGGEAGTPPLAHAAAVMFVVDQTHTPLGSQRRVWLSNVRYGR